MREGQEVERELGKLLVPVLLQYGGIIKEEEISWI